MSVYPDVNKHFKTHILLAYYKIVDASVQVRLLENHDSPTHMYIINQ